MYVSNNHTRRGQTQEEMSMKYSQTVGAAMIIACASTAFAGAVVDLEPNMVAPGLSGITNVMMPELVGTVEVDIFTDFEIYADEEGIDQSLLYQATLMTRVVRSNETGNLHFNYMIMDPNGELAGQVSHIEISGFTGLQTRVEFRNELTAPGDEGPTTASRSADGDVLTFDFEGSLDSNEESKFFFAMLDVSEFGSVGQPLGGDAQSTATIYLTSGEQVVFEVPGAVPTPGALALLSAAGLITTRRRR
jgi:hypothetical protein